MERRTFLALCGALPFLSHRSLGKDKPALPDLIGSLRTNWSRDPLSLGSYSYIAKGSNDGDRAVVSESMDDRVFFAGEALNPRHQSTVHAAHESGLIAAEAVQAHTHRRVAVIGAGMCGLTAAHALAEQGLEVVVFEARDRVGGRVWTDRTLGPPLDLGASWIHSPTGNPLTALADRVGMERVETDDTTLIRGKGGRTVPWVLRPAWLREVETTVSSGTELETLNVPAYALYGDGYSGEDVKFPGGYDAIFSTLEGDYELRLSTAVRRIARSIEGVSIGARDTEQAERFDAVIVTVPLGVLKQGDVAFEPPLPEKKTEALSRMEMGTLDKVYLHFEDVFWERDIMWIYLTHTGLPRGQFNVWLNLAKYLDVPLIMALNGGAQARALGGLTDEALIARAIGVLELNYGA